MGSELGLQVGVAGVWVHRSVWVRSGPAVDAGKEQGADRPGIYRDPLYLPHKFP